MVITVAKQIVSYYCSITGHDWSDFFSSIDTAMDEGTPAENLSDDLWLVRKLVDTAVAHGVSINDLKINKDAVKSLFDDDGRRNAGEFFTPEIWCQEGRKYFDKFVPNWRSMAVWDGSCGSGNLLRSAGVPAENLYLSSLQSDDIDVIRSTPEFAGATAFQLDFLAEVDYDEINTLFLNKLPEKLQEVIRNDSGLVVYMNPPYKSGMAKTTDMGRCMFEEGLGAAAYDLYYQFIFRMMKLVDVFHLKNVWFGVFGPVTFFTLAGASILHREFEKRWEFIDGFCLSSTEFSDTSTSIHWGISFTLWKARGGYVADAEQKDVLLSRKFKLFGGGIETKGRVLYETTREPLSEWCEPKDIMFYKDAPVMTSHLTFKGGTLNEYKVRSSARLADNALGTLMCCDTLTRSQSQSAVLSVPSTIQGVMITEENFWRCVANFSFRQVYTPDWSNSKKRISAPNTRVEGYEDWVKNALVMFMLAWKSMMNSLRNVDWNGYPYTIRNSLFFLSADDVRAHCHDERILKDLEENPPCNEFLLEQIEKSKDAWHPDVRAYYDWCRDLFFETFDKRSEVGYECGLDAWDAGIAQLRSSKLWNDDLQAENQRRLALVRDVLRKPVDAFGFVPSSDDADDEGVDVPDSEDEE